LYDWKNTNYQCDVSGSHQHTGTDFHFQLIVIHYLIAATAVKLGGFQTDLKDVLSYTNDRFSGGVLSVVDAF
jgi:hypothetical protein